VIKISNASIIQEYLVSLGFEVDNNSFNAMNKSINGVGKEVSKMAEGVVGSFLIAGIGVTSFVTTACLGLAKFMDSLGHSAIENEIFARRMWTTQESAMALNSTLKTMGVSLQDLYLSPTLMSQFQLLRQEATQLALPLSDYKQMAQTFQGITFEFTRMKLEATYSMQWIGYYFAKYMAEPLVKIKTYLENINSIIIKTMPTWTRIVAKVMTDFVRMGESLLWAGKGIAEMFEKIPAPIKLAAAAFVILNSPMLTTTALLVLALLLLEDFYSYMKGDKSALGPFWKDLNKDIAGVKKSIEDVYTTLKKSGAIKNFEDAFKHGFNTIKTLGEGFGSWFKGFDADLGKSHVLTDILVDFSAFINKFTTFTDDLTKNKGFKAIFGALGLAVKAGLEVALSEMDLLLKGLTRLFTAMDDVTKGDWKGAYDALNGVNKEGKDYIQQNPYDSKDYRNSYAKPTSEYQYGDSTDLTPSVPTKKTPNGNAGGIYGTPSLKSGFNYGQYNSLTPQSYIYPNPSNTNNHVTNTLNQTNHIYGSGSGSAGDVIKQSGKDIVRNWQGVMI